MAVLVSQKDAWIEVITNSGTLFTQWLIVEAMDHVLVLS